MRRENGEEEPEGESDTDELEIEVDEEGEEDAGEGNDERNDGGLLRAESNGWGEDCAEDDDEEDGGGEAAFGSVFEEYVVRVVGGCEDTLLQPRLDEAEAVGPPSEERTLPRESPCLFPKLLAFRDGRCPLRRSECEFLHGRLHGRELCAKRIETQDHSYSDAEYRHGASQ